MIVHQMEQGSAEWHMIRAGKVTASRFASVMTEAQMKYSASAKNVIAELIAEQQLKACLDTAWEGNDIVTGIDFGGNVWTRRGSDLEDEARLWYAAFKDVDVERVGFVATDDGRMGCSPDGLVGEDGVLEIKCRGAQYHMRMVLGYDAIAPRTQTQGTLWVTGRKWIDSLAYNPYLTKRIQRELPDPEWIARWDECVKQFWREFETAEQVVAAVGEVIEGDNLIPLLTASLAVRENFDHARFLDLVEECRARRIFDASDVVKVMEDLRAERWNDVDAMQRYMERALADGGAKAS